MPATSAVGKPSGPPAMSGRPVGENILSHRDGATAKSFSQTAAISHSKAVRGGTISSRRASVGSARGTGSALRSTLPLGKVGQGRHDLDQGGRPVAAGKRGRSLADGPSTSGAAALCGTGDPRVAGGRERPRAAWRRRPSLPDTPSAPLRSPIAPPGTRESSLAYQCARGTRCPIGWPTGEVAGSVKAPGRAAVSRPGDELLAG